jgi:hypothetical protein
VLLVAGVGFFDDLCQVFERNASLRTRTSRADYRERQAPKDEGPRFPGKEQAESWRGDFHFGGAHSLLDNLLDIIVGGRRKLACVHADGLFDRRVGGGEDQ